MITGRLQKGLTDYDHGDADGEKPDRLGGHAAHGQLAVHEAHEGVDGHEHHAGRGSRLFRNPEQEGEDGERADVDAAVSRERGGGAKSKRCGAGRVQKVRPRGGGRA